MDMFLDKLSRVATEVKLPNGTLVTVRALSQFERQQVDRSAFAESSRFVERLQDKNSDEYAAYILPLRQGEQSEIINQIISWRRVKAIYDSYKEIPSGHIPISVDAKDDERRELINQREALAKTEAQKRDEYVEGVVVAYRKELEGYDREKLLVTYDKQSADGFANQVTQDMRQYYSLYAACSDSKGQRAFTFDEIKTLGDPILSALATAYHAVNDADPFLLLKPSATVSSTPLADSSEKVSTLPV